MIKGLDFSILELILIDLKREIWLNHKDRCQVESQSWDKMLEYETPKLALWWIEHMTIT